MGELQVKNTHDKDELSVEVLLHRQKLTVNTKYEEMVSLWRQLEASIGPGHLTLIAFLLLAQQGHAMSTEVNIEQCKENISHTFQFFDNCTQTRKNLCSISYRVAGCDERKNADKSDVCISCSPGYFMDAINSCPRCIPCSQCKNGENGLNRCRSSSDTQCGPQIDYGTTTQSIKELTTGISTNEADFMNSTTGYLDHSTTRAAPIVPFLQRHVPFLWWQFLLIIGGTPMLLCLMYVVLKFIYCCPLHHRYCGLYSPVAIAVKPSADDSQPVHTSLV